MTDSWHSYTARARALALYPGYFFFPPRTSIRESLDSFSLLLSLVPSRVGKDARPGDFSWHLERTLIAFYRFLNVLFSSSPFFSSALRYIVRLYFVLAAFSCVWVTSKIKGRERNIYALCWCGYSRTYLYFFSPQGFYNFHIVQWFVIGGDFLKEIPWLVVFIQSNFKNCMMDITYPSSRDSATYIVCMRYRKEKVSLSTRTVPFALKSVLRR